MKWTKFLVAPAAIIAVAGAAGYFILVPAEAHRPPPAGVAAPNLVPIATPFTHRWRKEISHPLLAAAAIDIDGNGRDEVFLGGSDGQADALLAWRDGKLVDIAAEIGIGDEQATYGALSIDLDGDGRVDLITAGHAGIVFWMNKGGRFERRPLAVKIPEGGVPMAVTAGDFDRDGNVDLYVSVFVEPAQFRSPVFNDPAHAKPNLLLRGLGNLEFEDVTDEVTGGLQNTFTSAFVDLDGNGWLDLVLAQNTGEVEILRNLGNGKFERTDFRSGYGFWMGLAFGDINRNGRPDIFLSNVGNSIPSFLIKGDRRDNQPPATEWLLLRNDGDFRFTDITAEAGADGFGFAWGGVFEDVNLNGALDLLVAENYIKWPIHGLFRLPGKLLLGATDAGPKFFTSNAASNPLYGHVPLIADIDGDGRNDILWVNMDGPAQAYLNKTEGRFISVRIPDAPVSIGARIKLEGMSAPVQTYVSGEGLTSDRTSQYTFGLPGDAPAPSTIVIEWLDGKVTRIESPPLNQAIAVDAP